jgi:hypothetical protein
MAGGKRDSASPRMRREPAWRLNAPYKKQRPSPIITDDHFVEAMDPLIEFAAPGQQFAQDRRQAAVITGSCSANRCSNRGHVT